jgi:ArsR family transcriptional regulator, arsenate/arsenite/antimonite-responsive transcriptional repressor
MQMKSTSHAPNTDATDEPGPRVCCAEISSLFDPVLFKALSDPNRIAILASLAICDEEQSVSRIAEQFELNFSVVSRHLKIMRDAQVLNARKNGKEVLYLVNANKLADVLKRMAAALETCCGGSDAGTTQIEGTR